MLGGAYIVVRERPMLELRRSRWFGLGEFARQVGGKLSPRSVESYLRLARTLDTVRDRHGAPILVISGQRPKNPRHSASYHLPPEVRVPQNGDDVAADVRPMRHTGLGPVSVDETYQLFRWIVAERDAGRLAVGGVEFYPESNFIHIDNGPRRAWPEESGRAVYERAKGIP